MITRQALQGLKDWLSSPQRKPLVIRGARQVGKTELVRSFAKDMKHELVEFNLEEITLSEFERQNHFDIDRAIAEMEALSGRKFGSRTILFLDEIQASAFAYPRLRYFREKKPELAVICAGSLLELELHDAKISAPVGRVSYLYLGPLSFSEFLLASKDAHLWQEVKKLKGADKNPISLSTHEKLSRYLTDYLFVGGMPEAVNAFFQGGQDVLAARRIQSEIIQTYREDIRKYTQGKIENVVLEVLDRSPFEVGRKVIYSHFSKAKSTYVKEAIDILERIFVLQKVYHSGCGGLPLKKSQDTEVFKTYWLDVGLYNCFMEIKYSDLIALDPDALLSKGDMAEQFVAQHLYFDRFRSVLTPLSYWLRDKTPGNAEVDFVIAKDSAIVPIEVKAGKPGTIRSLLQFMQQKHKNISHALRFDLEYREKLQQHVKLEVAERKLEFTLRNDPLYAIELWSDG